MRVVHQPARFALDDGCCDLKNIKDIKMSDHFLKMDYESLLQPTSALQSSKNSNAGKEVIPDIEAARKFFGLDMLAMHGQRVK